MGKSLELPLKLLWTLDADDDTVDDNESEDDEELRPAKRPRNSVVIEEEIDETSECLLPLKRIC